MPKLSIPDKYSDLMNKRALAFLATIMPDGSPQVTPVWFDIAEGLIRVNTARGRQKDRNMTRDPRVALTIQDPDDTYRYLQIRGVVVVITEQGGDDHIDLLAKKYLGEDSYPWRSPADTRVIYSIQPEKISSYS